MIDGEAVKEGGYHWIEGKSQESDCPREQEQHPSSEIEALTMTPFRQAGRPGPFSLDL
jgi:hypothetical protein